MQTADVGVTGLNRPVEDGDTVTILLSFDFGNQVYSLGGCWLAGIINLQAIFHSARGCFIQVYTK